MTRKIPVSWSWRCKLLGHNVERQKEDKVCNNVLSCLASRKFTVNVRVISASFRVFRGKTSCERMIEEGDICGKTKKYLNSAQVSAEIHNRHVSYVLFLGFARIDDRFTIKLSYRIIEASSCITKWRDYKKFIIASITSQLFCNTKISR